MKKIRVNNICVGIVAMFLVIGCKKPPLNIREVSSVEDVIRRVVINPNMPSSAKDRANYVLSLYNNGIIDNKPVLIVCGISQIVGSEDPVIELIFYDENDDVVGFGIKEIIEDDTTDDTMQNEYPVFYHNKFSSNIHIRNFDVKLLTKENSKTLSDVKGEWDNFTKLNLDLSTYEPVPIPTIYVGDLQKYGHEALAWIYDKAGNKSDPVRLINNLRGETIR